MEDRLTGLPRRGALALAALAAILTITVAWWALALWPAGAATPEWVERTRAACFGVAPGGLPNAGGWVLLIGEPLGMLGILLTVWGDAVREGLRALRSSRAGRAALMVTGILVLIGSGAAMTRIHGGGESLALAQDAPGASARLDKVPPPLALIGQHGDSIRLEQFRGRPVLVTFAYAHCQTVCPVAVRDAVVALEQTRALRPAVLVVTLDPWRDTPSRLATIAASWELPDDAYVLSGSVESVEQTLDAWQIPRRRDPLTGEITHPTSVFVIDRSGRVAYIASADGRQLAKLIRRS